jgi:hypothetical protein
MSTTYDGEATSEAEIRIYPTRERHKGMAVAKINGTINALNWDEVMKMPPGEFKEVCAATVEEWEAYIESEEQTLKARHMEWFDGKIWIVELPTTMHSNACRELVIYISLIPGTRAFLGPRGDAHTSTGPKFLPDESYGPHALRMPPLGAVLPNGVDNWPDFSTLKVEIGATRLWGGTFGLLDWKANQWATFPGVAYILCIALAIQQPAHLPDFTYKLYEVEMTGRRLPEQPPVPIVAPSTVVTFNSRRLLGLPTGAALPPGFPDPDLTVDLYVALQEIFDLVRHRVY